MPHKWKQNHRENQITSDCSEEETYRCFAGFQSPLSVSGLLYGYAMFPISAWYFRFRQYNYKQQKTLGIIENNYETMLRGAGIDVPERQPGGLIREEVIS